MVEFVFTTILMACLLAVLYLMVRALPRIAEEPATESGGLLDRWAHSEIPEKIDAAFNGFLFKLLRKIKILILRIDNSVGLHLQKMKAKDDDHVRRSAIDFREMAEGSAERRIQDRRRFGRRISDQPPSQSESDSDNLPV